MYTHTSTHTDTTYTHTHTTYTHTYVARSLTHIHMHARTHTTLRHAALFARHAVAPAVSVVVLFREAPPQALRCSGATAPTKTQGKAGRFADLAYTAHGKNDRSLNAAFVCVATAINPACKWPSQGGGPGASRAGHSREVWVMANLMIMATSKTGRQAMPGMLTGPARGLPGGYHSLGSASMGRCGLERSIHTCEFWCQIPVSYHPPLNSTKSKVMQVT